jgi:hypothetical protein
MRGAVGSAVRARAPSPAAHVAAYLREPPPPAAAADDDDGHNADVAEGYLSDARVSAMVEAAINHAVRASAARPAAHMAAFLERRAQPAVCALSVRACGANATRDGGRATLEVRYL